MWTDRVFSAAGVSPPHLKNQWHYSAMSFSSLSALLPVWQRNRRRFIQVWWEEEVDSGKRCFQVLVPISPSLFLTLIFTPCLVFLLLFPRHYSLAAQKTPFTVQVWWENWKSRVKLEEMRVWERMRRTDQRCSLSVSVLMISNWTRVSPKWQKWTNFVCFYDLSGALA